MASTAARRLSQILPYLSGTTPTPPPYVAPPPTKEKLDYADLAIIDLSQAKTAAGRAALASKVVRAMTTHGFFYVVNHGYTQEQTARVFSIANLTFDGVGDAEKKVYAGQSGAVYEGYKPRQTWRIDDDVHDQIEHYNINRDVRRREHPAVLRPYVPEIEAFARHNHFNILHPILRLLALGLELPEETLVSQHSFNAAGESSVRFMKYYPRSHEEELRTRQVWLKGHTDIGSVTILWSQPISGLQILSPDGKWRWVRHIDNALASVVQGVYFTELNHTVRQVINAGDVLTFLCGGFYPATRHRVIQPPADQVGRARVGVFYFSMANDDVRLVPHEESPVLQRVGIHRVCKNEDAPTMAQWRRDRTTAYGSSQLVPSKQEKNVEEEVISGVLVKHYN